MTIRLLAELAVIAAGCLTAAYLTIAAPGFIADLLIHRLTLKQSMRRLRW